MSIFWVCVLYVGQDPDQRGGYLTFLIYHGFWSILFWDAATTKPCCGFLVGGNFRVDQSIFGKPTTSLTNWFYQDPRLYVYGIADIREFFPHVLRGLIFWQVNLNQVNIANRDSPRKSKWVFQMPTINGGFIRQGGRVTGGKCKARQKVMMLKGNAV